MLAMIGGGLSTDCFTFPAIALRDISAPLVPIALLRYCEMYPVHSL